MTRIFFSHASEDKDMVEAIYTEFRTAFPAYSPWLDKYEIVGGDSLITKITEGMDEADKFFIFLSPTAVNKPWVQRELKRAIMREIKGVDPDYIVPVKIGDLDQVPPFLEDKLYIDVPRMKKDEWLSQFDAAIKGKVQKPTQGQENVDVAIKYGETKNVAIVTFAARAWAERFSFAVRTKEDLVSADLGGIMGTTNGLLLSEPRLYAEAFDAPTLRPGNPISIVLKFREGIDAINAIDEYGRWQPVDPRQAGPQGMNVVAN